MTVDYSIASADLKRYLPLKFATVLWFLVALGIATYAVAATWREWLPYTELNISSEDLGKVKPVIYATAAGVIGSTLYAFRGFYWAVGPQDRANKKYQYDPNWTWWYFTRPLIGGFLAMAVYALLQAGVATLGETEADDTSSSAYFGVGFLAGFAATDVYGWLAETSKDRFGKREQADDKPAGGAVAGGDPEV